MTRQIKITISTNTDFQNFCPKDKDKKIGEFIYMIGDGIEYKDIQTQMEVMLKEEMERGLKNEGSS